MGTILQISPALEVTSLDEATRGRFHLRATSSGALNVAAVVVETPDTAGLPAWRFVLRDRGGASVGVLELWPELAIGNGLAATSKVSLETLTRRQKEILELVANGCAVKTIAKRLDISVKTVEFHKTRLMRRLGLHGTAELTRFAVAAGLISL